MFKKTLGLIAILLLLIIGEGYWLIQSGVPGKILSLITQEASSLSDLSSTDTDTIGEEAIPTVVATLGDATGDVTVLRDDEPLPLVPFMPLLTNDRIETGIDGRAEIGWTGYGRTLIAPNSTIIITDAEPGVADDGFVAQIKIEAGRIWTRFDKLLSAGSSFEVKASNVVATVRGTSFGMEIDTLGTIQIKVAKSKVAVARTVDADSDEIVGSFIDVNEMERMELAENGTSLSKPIKMLPAELQQDKFLIEGNAEVPKEYMDMQWMALVEMILSQIPPDQIPPDFDRAGFIEYMRQVQLQIPPEVLQQLKSELQTN